MRRPGNSRKGDPAFCCSTNCQARRNHRSGKYLVSPPDQERRNGLRAELIGSNTAIAVGVPAIVPRRS